MSKDVRVRIPPGAPITLKETLMISDTDANKIDEWLRKFQKNHNELEIVDDDIIKSLACALCDDIPLGYEASHRLANWLFCYLNRPHISNEGIKRIS